jgi:hypothetical protein
MPILEEYYDVNDDSHTSVTSTQWGFQTFTPGTLSASDYLCTMVALKGWVVESSGNLIVELRTTSGGKPTSTILATQTVAKSAISLVDPGAWFSFPNFASPPTLVHATEYAIVVRASSGTFAWRRDFTLASYTGGDIGYSTNSGATWIAQGAGKDAMFRTYSGEPPTITGQSSDTTVTEGDVVNLFVTTTGDPPITYQWYKDLVAIPGATAATYQFYTGFDSAGSYTCTATNVDGSDTTVPAIVVTVTLDSHWRSPTAYSDPSSVWSNEGNAFDANTSTFASASVADQTYCGTLNLTWTDRYVVSKIEFNATKNLVNVATCKVELYYDGTWNSVYDTTTHTDNGWCVVTLPVPKQVYQARVSFYNSYGGGGSATAKLYEFRYYGYEIPVITAQSSSSTVQLSDPVVLSVTANGEATLTYQWYKDGNILTGETNSTLSFTTGATSGGSYTCIVTNSYGTDTSDAIVITVDIAAPVITSHSNDVLCFSGFFVAILVTATGKPTPTYQWYKDSVLIAGATSSTYSFFADGPSVHVYTCTATNVAGSDTSDPITVTAGGAAPNNRNLFNPPLNLSFED